MENELSDRERFIVQAAYHCLIGKKYDRTKAWKHVRRCTSYSYKLQKTVLTACVLFCFFISASLYYLNRNNSSLQEDCTQYSEIQKASGTPILTLGNGQQIPLHAELSREISKQARTDILVDSNTHRIQYFPSPVAGQDTSLQYHTLEIPKGGEYMLILADGSKIWLNSESTLRFPVKFTSHKREIYLTGEIYLEVAHDSERPFYVHAGKQTIVVLGTRFNVRHYPTDSYWSTTLVEGKIQINSNAATYFLNPGEHYTETHNGKSPEITFVNTGQYISWVQGKINFKNERLEEIIRQLQRWYDFEVFYANPELKELHFGGAINKYNSFDVVLRYLERTADIRFEIRNKTVIVRKI